MSPIVPPATEQSVPEPSHANKRKTTKADKAEKEVSAALSTLRDYLQAFSLWHSYVSWPKDAGIALHT